MKTVTSVISKRGQTVVPAYIRNCFQIKVGDKLVWLFDGEMIVVVPVPADPVGALRGIARGERLLERLLQERGKDRNRGS